MVQNGFAPESKETKIKRTLSVRNTTDPSDLLKHSWTEWGFGGWGGGWGQTWMLPCRYIPVWEPAHKRHDSKWFCPRKSVSFSPKTKHATKQKGKEKLQRDVLQAILFLFFLMRPIPLRLYTCEAQSAAHETLQQQHTT